MSRYVDGLLAVRGPADLVFVAIVPVPERLLPNPRAPDYDAILADPDLSIRFDLDTGFVEPACVLAVESQGAPPRRILTARGSRDGDRSICSAGFRAAASSMSALVVRRLVDRCATRWRSVHAALRDDSPRAAGTAAP